MTQRDGCRSVKARPEAGIIEILGMKQRARFQHINAYTDQLLPSIQKEPNRKSGDFVMITADDNYVIIDPPLSGELKRVGLPSRFISIAGADDATYRLEVVDSEQNELPTTPHLQH